MTVHAALSLGDECAVLFGPSVAGKSTLLRMIAGLSRPDRGSVRLGGETLLRRAAHRNVPLRRRRIGVIFQDDLLFPHLDVAANVAFGLHGRNGVEARRRVREVAALCGIEACSIGGRRRFPAASVSASAWRGARARPRLLLCDEPVSALDLDSRIS